MRVRFPGVDSGVPSRQCPGPRAAWWRGSVHVPPWSVAAVVCAALVLSACAPQAEPANGKTAGTPAAGVRRLTIAVPLDTGPLNIYSSDPSFDYLV